MADVFEGKPDSRQTDAPSLAAGIAATVFRKRYRQLSDAEVALHDELKDRATDLYAVIERIKACRETSIAKTKLEEAIMWAAQAITA